MSDFGYIDPPFEYRGEELTQAALQRMMTLIPGWVPREGHLEVWMLEVVARLVAEARVVASSVPRSIFRYYGESIVGLAPTEAARARTTSTWTAIDTAGYTIDAGTLVALRRTGDETVVFEVESAVVIPPGVASTTPGQVSLIAVNEGEEANGLPAQTTDPIDQLAWVAQDGVTTLSLTAGGVDAESDESYLNRLVDELRLLTPRPILADDFATLARRIAGVHRAIAIDGYNPGDATFNNERMVTVAVVDENGAAVSAGTKAAVDAYLQSEREVNFIVHVVDPTFTSIDVDVDFSLLEGYVAADVEAAVVEAVENYLDPGTWGGGDQDPPDWRSSANTVRYLELAALINSVDGVDYITALSFGVSGGALAQADVLLAGVAPLPNVGAVTADAV